MPLYICAFRKDGGQILGNLDGQASIKASAYRRTLAYKHLRSQSRPAYVKVAYWEIQNSLGTVLETIENPRFGTMWDFSYSEQDTNLLNHAINNGLHTAVILCSTKSMIASIHAIGVDPEVLTSEVAFGYRLAAYVDGDWRFIRLSNH